MKYRQRYKERAEYLKKVCQHRAVVAGRIDYDFTQHLTPAARSTYEGQALIEKWRRECFDTSYFNKLEIEVETLAALADWEEADDRRWRRKNRMPPTSAELKELLARRTARAIIEDEPPPLPALPNDTQDDTAAAARSPADREELTLFGSLRKIQQVVPTPKGGTNNED